MQSSSQPRSSRPPGRPFGRTRLCPTDGKSWWKQIAKKLALLLGTLVVLTALLEIGARLFTDTIPPLTVRDPAVGQHYLESFEGMVYVPEAGREVYLRFNKVGFRGPDRPWQKPEGVRRVAVLGDSMIASLAVDEEDTMVCRLERMLNQSHPDVTWEVFNFGVSGASPGQELVLYRELVSRFQPDIVLCAFFVGNDLADNCRRLSHSPRIYFDLDESGDLYQLPFSARRARLSQFLNRYSRFYVWQKGAFLKTRKKVRASAGLMAPRQWIYCRKENQDVAHAWKLSGEVIKAFHHEAESRGARFAVVMIPPALQIYENSFQRMLEKVGDLAPHFDPDYPDQRMGELCREAGVPFLSMLEDFREAAPSANSKVKQEWLFLLGEGHFNERGNALAARAIHRFLTRGDPNQLAGRPFVGRPR